MIHAWNDLYLIVLVACGLQGGLIGLGTLNWIDVLIQLAKENEHWHSGVFNLKHLIFGLMSKLAKSISIDFEVLYAQI